MENVKTSCWMILIAAVLLTACGCNESQAQKKQAMKEKWLEDTAQSKVPLIESMLDRGEIEPARKMLSKSLEEDPLNPHYHVLAGRICIIDDQMEQARQRFETAIQLDDQLAEGWYCLGSLAVIEKSYDSAIEYYQKACQLDAQNADYSISLADVLLETGQVSQAEELVRSELDRHSQNLDLILALAQIKQHAGQTDQAISLYEQALMLHGDLPEILSPCGYSYMAQSKWVKAAQKFEKLLVHCKKDSPQYHSTLRLIGICSFNYGNYGRAMECYDELSITFRDDAEIWLNMAQCALGADETDKAVYYAKKALKHQSYLPGAYAVLGSSLYMKGDFQGSLDSFHRITSDDELAGFAWFMVGRCYQQLGRTEQANAAYQRAEQLDPENELITVFLKKTVQSL